MSPTRDESPDNIDTLKKQRLARAQNEIGAKVLTLAALRVGLTLLIATALTGATAFFILDRALLAQVQSRTAIFWRLRNGLAVQFLCVWALVGALLTAAQRKETPPVRRVLCGTIGAFFLTHFVFSALAFFY